MPYQHAFEFGPVDGKKDDRYDRQESIKNDGPRKSFKIIYKAKHATGHSMYREKERGLLNGDPSFFGRSFIYRCYNMTAMVAKAAAFVHGKIAIAAMGQL